MGTAEKETSSRAAAAPRQEGRRQRWAAALVSARQDTGRVAFGLAFFRGALGLMVAFIHGWHKAVEGAAHFTSGAPWPLVGDVVAVGLPVPTLFATLAALTQLVGGLLLAAGLFTRPSALGVSVTMGVAFLLNVTAGGPDAELAALYGLAALGFAFVGGGRFSGDEVFFQRRGPSRKTTAS
jgi:putative oxidoreductase